MSHVAGIPTQLWGTMQLMSLPTQTLRARPLMDGRPAEKSITKMLH